MLVYSSHSNISILSDGGFTALSSPEQHSLELGNLRSSVSTSRHEDIKSMKLLPSRRPLASREATDDTLSTSYYLTPTNINTTLLATKALNHAHRVLDSVRLLAPFSALRSSDPPSPFARKLDETSLLFPLSTEHGLLRQNRVPLPRAPLAHRRRAPLAHRRAPSRVHTNAPRTTTGSEWPPDSPRRRRAPLAHPDTDATREP